MNRILSSLIGAVAVVGLATSFVASPAPAQELRTGPGGEPPLLLPRIDGPIVLDGRPDEAAWEDAALLEPVMHLPDFGAEPTERTEFLLAHDGEFLYFACRAYDSEPDGIRVTSLRRDESSYQTDACGIRLDPFNDEQNAVIFSTTPAGARTDWTFANDASGPPNSSWDTFWDAAGTRAEWGWAAEIRVPFSSLRYQVEDGRVVMGFALGRSIVRKNETVVHPAIPPRWGPSSIAKPSQMRKLILEGVDEEHPLYATLYGLAGGGYAHALDGAEDGYVRERERVWESGVDFKYGLTRNVVLDVTVNTDFAQVEADDQQVNLTRFSLFFPEKRRFFQEGAALFEFSLGGQERLFHSRRIGLAGGEPVRIYGGARVVGRVGEWDVAFLDLQTAEHEGFASENMGVARLRRRVLNDYSYVGGIVTSRLGADGGYNVLYGADAVVRLFGQDYVTVNWAESFDDAHDGRAGAGLGPLDRSLARLSWERRGTDGLVYAADLTRTGPVFEPGLGFLRRRDYVHANGRLGYGWRPGRGAALNRYALRVDGGLFRRGGEGTIESADYGIEGVLETRGGHTFTVSGRRSYEDLVADFSLSEGAWVPVGSYWFTEAGVRYGPPSGGLFRPSVGVEGGRFYDGTRLSFDVSPTWSLSRHLRVGGAYGVDRIAFDERDQRFTAHVARLRAEVMFTTSLSALAFVQYNSAEGVVVANLRIRYNPREGNDLYLVWNEGLNADRFAYAPVPPVSQDRTLLVKYSHTLTLDF